MAGRKSQESHDATGGSETSRLALLWAGLGARLGDRGFRAHIPWLVAIFVVAVVARSLWVWWATADITDERLYADDAWFYHGSAVALADGHGYVSPWTGTATAYWPPGYTFFLAGLYLLFGPHAALAWGANIVLGALTCVTVYLLGCLMAGRRVGAIAGLLLAIFPGHIAFSSLLMTEVLFTFLVVGAMALIAAAAQKDDTRWRWAIVIGVVVGAAALVRGQGLVLVLVAGVFWWVRSGDWAHSLQRATLVLITAVVVIAPWSIRNFVAMESFVFISTNDGENFYIGNNQYATGGYNPVSAYWIGQQYANLPREQREVKRSNLALREGLQFMITHPWRELKLTGSRIRELYKEDGYAVGSLRASDGGRADGVVDVIEFGANAVYFAVLGLSAGGVLWWPRRPRSAVALPMLVIVMFTLGQLPFFSLTRYHVPMLPSFCLLAAVALVWGADSVRNRWFARFCRRDGSAEGSTLDLTAV